MKQRDRQNAAGEDGLKIELGKQKSLTKLDKNTTDVER
jgi:hypothetical protein